MPQLSLKKWIPMERRKRPVQMKIESRKQSGSQGNEINVHPRVKASLSLYAALARSTNSRFLYTRNTKFQNLC
ncbi:unnamed protein product [Calicophoron daubneyi]|uniref:Uncharacterized protein n=1 Tax=Calicophoron daubneyi TaxID=300641 RepID=A0AAV2TP12_CALDB